jgi:hypothetical protein
VLSVGKQKREQPLNLIDCLESRFVAENTLLSRRRSGVTFTPQWVVDQMLDLVGSMTAPYPEIVDAGAGAGRFSIAAATRFPGSRIIAIEKDIDLATGLERTARDQGLGKRVEVRRADFLECALSCTGRRLFLGNPPYVRHHALSALRKAWLKGVGTRLAKRFSGLSGLHIYFLARILAEARAGDGLLMILPSEWMEARYGAAIKAAILERARKVRLFLFPPDAEVFEGTMTTSVILSLEFGGPTEEFLVALADRDCEMCADGMKAVRLPASGAEQVNWLHLANDALEPKASSIGMASSYVELGELFDVHRGQVTGKNVAWIATRETASLIPDRFLFPCVTEAKDIFDLDGDVLRAARTLRRVIDLPADLGLVYKEERDEIIRFLKLAKNMGAAAGYIASHRKPWWKVSLRDAPSIVMTYMGRRAPRFAVNGCYARLLNIAHGLYPKVKFSRAQLLNIVRWLNSNGGERIGRTYAGGLVKVEPGDARRIRMPDPRNFEFKIAA